MFAHAIVCVAAQKGAYLVEDMIIERRQQFQLTFRCWDTELARECSDIHVMQGQRLPYAYVQNAPNNKHLGYAPNNAKIQYIPIMRTYNINCPSKQISNFHI